MTGDIIVSLDRVTEQARRFRVSRGRELARLVIHGALHLAGLDHHTAPERRRMRAEEERVIRASARAIAALQRAALALVCAWALAGALPWAAHADGERPRLAEIRHRMLAADTVLIGHYQPVPGDSSRPGAVRFRAVTGRRVTREWLERFLDATLVPARYDSGRVCNLFAVGMDTLRPLMFSVLTKPHADAVGIGLEFRTRCAGVFVRGEEIGAIDMEPMAAKLLALVREALPADSALRLAALPPEFEPPGGRRKERPQPSPELPPVALTRVPPEYPLAARKAGISGTVQVKALVDTDGNVTRAMIQSPVSAELDSAAVTAVRQWKFKPASDGRRPVAVWVTLPVRFTLR